MEEADFLKAVIAAAIDGIILIDAEGQVELFNPACERLFGYRPDEVIGRNVKMLMPEPYHAEHDGYIARYRGTGEKRIIGIGREVIGRRKDGSTFPFELAVNEYRRNGKQMFVGFIHDTSLMRGSEAAQRQSERRFAAVVDAAIDGIILIDKRGRIELFNPACERLFGYLPHEVMGRNVSMLMPEPYQSEHDGYIARHQDTGENRIIGKGREVTGRRKDGSTFPFELAVNVFERDGEPMYAGFIHDVTARNKAEEQLRQAQKAEAIGQLTSGIAHDFNNLLAVIIGNLELLSDRVTDEAGRKLIDLALRSGLRGAELTQRLLAFGRQQKLKPTRLDANKLITNLVDLMRRTLGETVVIDTALAADLLPIEADPGQLENALINLALNARDAMPGGGRLTLRTANSDTTPDPAAAAGRYVLISVSDTGKGMTDEIRARVFEPFFTTKETGKGTGLGLSMVYGFITQSGGFVRIESAPGRGTEVRLYLPGSARAEDRSPVQPVASDAKTILAVEDNPDVRATTVAMLQMLGYGVVTAASGAEALDTLRRLPQIALMYTDVVMPGGMTGPELAEAALSLRPDLPVLFTSGSADDTHFRNTRFYGKVPLLRKPVRKQELAAALTKALTPRTA